MTDTGMVKITGRFKERIEARLQLKLLFVTHNMLHNSCDSCFWDVFSYSAKFRVKFANFLWFILFEQFSFDFVFPPDIWSPSHCSRTKNQELIIGDGGENIAPVPIEDQVKASCDGINEAHPWQLYVHSGSRCKHQIASIQH